MTQQKISLKGRKSSRSNRGKKVKAVMTAHFHGAFQGQDEIVLKPTLICEGCKRLRSMPGSNVCDQCAGVI